MIYDKPNFENLYNPYIQKKLAGRLIHLDHITPILSALKNQSAVSIIGKSVLDKPIYGCQFGNGKIKILIWSQMHGNESTTTKAIFDLFKFLESDDVFATQIINNFTLFFIPILNPDGAQLYTRENANQIDLNRDAQNLSQPESLILRKIFSDFKPNFCFNMHDQRSIFGVANSGLPATVSFLAPPFNANCDYNMVRQKAVEVIVAMNNDLQKIIPGQVGRFDDAFNINCVGDTFQSLGIATILFEAGHFQNDYQREKSRKYIYIALLSSFYTILENDVVNYDLNNYMQIPQNNPIFFDIVYKNVKIYYDNSFFITNFAIQYKEELINNTIFFNGFIAKIDDLENYFAHLEIDAKAQLFECNNENFPKINQKADFYLDKNTKIKNGLIISD